MTLIRSFLVFLLLTFNAYAGNLIVGTGGMGASGGGACSTPSQGEHYTEGFEGSTACYTAGTEVCENATAWTVVDGTQTFGYTLPSTPLSLLCSKGLRINVNEASNYVRLDEGTARADAKIIFYFYLTSSSAGTDHNFVSIGNSTTQGSSRWGYATIYNNAGTITMRCGGGVNSAWLPIAIEKVYKVTLNGNTTTPANSFMSVEDCSSGTCTDVDGSPDTDFRATVAGGASARYQFYGGLAAGASDITDFVFDVISVGAAD